MDHVEEALRVLYTTTNPSLRQSADKWLQDFQASDAAWELAVALISSGASAESRLFGCTVLCNKLRGGNLGGLPPESATSLRVALLQQLAALGGEYGALVANVEPQLCRAIAALLVGGVAALLGDPAFAALPAPSMLRVLALVPEGGALLETEEIEEMQILMLAWLDAAYGCADEAPCPYPPQIGATAPPAAGGRAHRVAVLECAGQWAALPASEHGLTLRRLATHVQSAA